MYKIKDLQKIGIQIVVGDVAECDGVRAQMTYNDIILLHSNPEHYDECYIVNFMDRTNNSGMQPVSSGVELQFMYKDGSEHGAVAGSNICWSECIGVSWKPKMVQPLLDA